MAPTARRWRRGSGGKWAVEPPEAARRAPFVRGHMERAPRGTQARPHHDRRRRGEGESNSTPDLSPGPLPAGEGNPGCALLTRAARIRWLQAAGPLRPPRMTNHQSLRTGDVVGATRGTGTDAAVVAHLAGLALDGGFGALLAALAVHHVGQHA